MSKDAQFYRPRPPIPLERQVEAIETIVLYPGNIYGRVIERGWIVDVDDEAVKLAPENFRRPAGRPLTR